MHPQFQLPEPGECPICFMDLIPLEEDDQAGLGPRDLVLSDAAAALAEIATAPVERRFAVRELTLVGKVTADETLQRVITARVPGRIERLYADYTGRQVRRGEKLAEVYSPELYQARAELESARAAVRRGDPGAAANLRSVEERLRLWDLDPDLVAAGTGDRITITAPLAGTVVRKDAVEGAYLTTGQPIVTIADLDRVWVELDAFERDLIWLARGQAVRFTVTALPGDEFEGTIEFVDPLLDDRTRTIRARLEVDNSDGRLRPGMLARGRVLAELAADGRPRAGRDAAEAPLVVPATAPLLTGERAVVYVREPGDEPRFRGVDVVLGPRAGDWFVLRDGLDEGDLVVVHGAFKLDSALQIQARTSMMLPEEVDPLPTLPEVPPCFEDVAADVVAAYLALQTGLAGDDEAAAREAARSLPSLLTMACRERLPDLAAAADAVAGADDMAGMRDRFEPLSDRLWLTMSAAGWTGEQPLRRFHCPMAFDDAGAHWLQLDETTANPYFGAMMLRCGLEVDRLGSGEGGS
jgi:Cu(I)/Ag(I) efflux system membrane fusion protein